MFRWNLLYGLYDDLYDDDDDLIVPAHLTSISGTSLQTSTSDAAFSAPPLGSQASSAMVTNLSRGVSQKNRGDGLASIVEEEVYLSRSISAISTALGPATTTTTTTTTTLQGKSSHQTSSSQHSSNSNGYETRGSEEEEEEEEEQQLDEQEEMFRTPTKTPTPPSPSTQQQDARFTSSPGWKNDANSSTTTSATKATPKKEYSSAPGWSQLGRSHQPNMADTPETSKLPLHRAAFDNDVEGINQFLNSLSEEEEERRLEQLTRLDRHGNTALHLAVLRRSQDALQALLDAGFPHDAKSEDGWTALDEALGCGDFTMSRAIHKHATEIGRRRFHEKRPQLQQLLESLPDMSFRLRWEFGSPIFSILLKKFAPSDTYRITKVGTYIRVDGTLRGLDEEMAGEETSGDVGRGGIIPKWKRGPFSIIIRLDGRGDDAKVHIYVLDHDKKEVVEMTDTDPNAESDDEEKTRRLDRKLDEEVRFMMAEASGGDSMCGDPDLRGGGLSGVGKTKMKTTNFVFEPMKNWMNSKDRVETVEGWTCRLYSASALLEAVSVLKGSPFAALRNHPGMTFEEYVKFEVGDKDTVLRLLSDTPENSPGGDALDLNDPSTSPRAAAAAAAAASREKEDAKKEKPRKVAARCWMAEDFPFSLKELLPLLHIIGRVNKTIMKVSKFIERYGTMDLFPVKLQVPIAMTVYLLVTFRDFQKRGDEPSKTNAGWGWFGGGSSGGGSFDTLIRPDDVPEGFFDIPSDYKEREVEDVLKEWSEEVEAKNGMEGNSELMDRELDDQSFAFL